jgi:hypothetical protein
MESDEKFDEDEQEVKRYKREARDRHEASDDLMRDIARGL